jgi:predicted DNA-binding transcriptional regulator AlpA
MVQTLKPTSTTNLITMTELAEHYGVSRPTIHRLMTAEVIKPTGKLPGKNGTWLFPKSQTIRILDKQLRRCPECGQLKSEPGKRGRKLGGAA